MSDANSAPLTAQPELWKANLATLAQRGEIIDTNLIMLVVFGSNNDDNNSAITYISQNSKAYPWKEMQLRKLRLAKDAMLTLYANADVRISIL
jgi:hypothetical protein